MALQRKMERRREQSQTLQLRRAGSRCFLCSN